MKRLLFILIALPFLFNSCQQNNPTPTGNNNTGNNNTGNNTGNNSSATTYTWFFEIKVNGVVHRIEGSFDDSSDPNKDYVEGPNYNYMSLTEGLIAADLNNKGESTYVSGENFSIVLIDNNIDLGHNDFILGEDDNQLGVEGYGGWGTSTVNGFSSFSLSPVDTNDFIQQSTFPVSITQLPSSVSYNNNTNSYDVGNPIMGNSIATIYTLDTAYADFTTGQSIYSYTRPYNIEINFKTYASPN